MYAATYAAFRVYLPLEIAAAEETAARPPASPTALHTGAVLLVEDDEPLRRLVFRILTGAGFTVLAG